MPKPLLHPVDEERVQHPFISAYIREINKAAALRKKIMQQNGWSCKTFYNKLRTKLTEQEAANIATTLNIPVTAIEEFQNGFIK